MAKSATVSKTSRNKKCWTGEEVGKLLISSMLNDFKGGASKPLFSQTEFEKMENSLVTEKDFLTYGVYKDIFRSVSDLYYRCPGIYQQFDNGFNRLYSLLKEIGNTERARNTLAVYPLIVTAEEYDRLRGEAAEELRARGESLYGLVFNIISSLTSSESGGLPNLPEEICGALKKTKNEPAENGRYTGIYESRRNADRRNGRMNDGANDDTHGNALGETPVGDANMPFRSKCRELFWLGADAVRQAVIDAGGEAPDADDDEIYAALDDILTGADTATFNPTARMIKKAFGYDTPPSPYEAPERLTRYDLLKAYTREFSLTYPSEPPYTRQKELLKDLKADYAELYTAVVEYVKNKIPKAKKLKAGGIYTAFISRGELAEAGIVGYDRRVIPGSRDIIDRYKAKNDPAEDGKALFSSVAVIQNSDAESVGYNIVRDSLSGFHDIISAASDAYLISEVKAYSEVLVNPALGYYYAFNALIGIIGRVYGLPELSGAAADTSVMEKHIGIFNELLYTVYYDAYRADHGQMRKCRLLKSVFSSLDSRSLTPSAQTVESVTEELSALGLSAAARQKLQYPDGFIIRLREKGGA